MDDANSINEPNVLSSEQVELVTLAQDATTTATISQSPPIPERMERARLNTDDRTVNSQILPEVPDAAPLVDSSSPCGCEWCLASFCFCFYWYDKQDDSYRCCCFDAENS